MCRRKLGTVLHYAASSIAGPEALIPALSFFTEKETALPGACPPQRYRTEPNRDSRKQGPDETCKHPKQPHMLNPSILLVFQKHHTIVDLRPPSSSMPESNLSYASTDTGKENRRSRRNLVAMQASLTPRTRENLLKDAAFGVRRPVTRPYQSRCSRRQQHSSGPRGYPDIQMPVGLVANSSVYIRCVGFPIEDYTPESRSAGQTIASDSLTLGVTGGLSSWMRQPRCE